ncbi:MAG: endo-1,4-beta-xylanase [Phycisphaeraceae bacterium]
MLKFLVFDDGRSPDSWPLRNPHLLGSDGNAMRADILFADGAVVVDKRESGAAALAIQQPVGDCGELTIQTCLLPDRDEPYLLSVEQARHRLMVLYNKLEDWGMFDLGPDHAVVKRTELALRLFIESLCCQSEDPAKADRLAKDSLVAAIDGSEELALAHAELLLNRRQSTGSLPKHPIGCGVSLDQTHERIRAGLLASFDFLFLPTSWRGLAPEEGEYQWAKMDDWADWAGRTRMNIIAGPIVSFEPHILPDWLYIWEHDYDTVRELIYEHVERVVSRYRSNVTAWNIVSGLHVNSHFSFSFEQLMDLTRMATMLVKKIQPAAKTLIEIQQPFGEYYSTNQRSIPPLMYADLVVQSAMNFEGFSLKLLMGQALPGQYTRDLMQISSMLDQFSVFGKPVYLTIAAPSEMVTQMMIAAPDAGVPVDPNSGYWRKPWSPLVQSHWLEALLQIAMSKPYIEAVAWHELIDHPEIEMPLAGLIGEDLQPKGAFRRLLAFRNNLLGNGQRKTNGNATIPTESAQLTEPPHAGAGL